MAKPPPFLPRPPSKNNKEHKALIVLVDTLRAAALIVATEQWLTYMCQQDSRYPQTAATGTLDSRLW